MDPMMLLYGSKVKSTENINIIHGYLWASVLSNYIQVIKKKSWQFIILEK